MSSCWACRIVIWAAVLIVIAMSAQAIAGSAIVGKIVALLMPLAGASAEVGPLTAQVTTGIITLICAGVAAITDWLCCLVGVKSCCGAQG